jgi:hypothetical protein
MPSRISMWTLGLRIFSASALSSGIHNRPHSDLKYVCILYCFWSTRWKKDVSSIPDHPIDMNVSNSTRTYIYHEVRSIPSGSPNVYIWNATRPIKNIRTTRSLASPIDTWWANWAIQVLFCSDVGISNDSCLSGTWPPTGSLPPLYWLYFREPKLPSVSHSSHN